MEHDLLSGAAEMLRQYGIDEGQLAVVAVSIAGMLGIKVSYRACAIAFGYAAGAGTQLLKWAFSKPPAPPLSAACEAALEALADEAAVYDQHTRTLLCTGLMAILAGEGDEARVSCLKAAPFKIAGHWSGTELLNILTREEKATVRGAVKVKVAEIVERDRQAANEAAANAIAAARCQSR